MHYKPKTPIKPAKNTSPSVILARCRRRVRTVIENLKSTMGEPRAGAANVHFLAGLAEVEEMQRWAAEYPEAFGYPKIGAEPFNAPEADLEFPKAAE